jgi:DNA-binding response OmpR family regulator
MTALSTAAGAVILIGDDDRDVRDTLVMLFESEGYCTVVAVDGVDALNLARRERPELILLDMGMPRLVGAGFCRAYRAEGGATAVVLISAGIPCAAASIEKPFDIDELLETVAPPVAS